MSKLLTDLDEIHLDAPIKVAFFDIDGTLLAQDGRYSHELQRQMARIRQGGVKTAIASGRPLFATQFLIEDLALRDPGVFCTGAYIYSPAQQQLLRPAPLDVDVCLALIRRCRQLDIYYELYTQHQFYVETSYAPHVRQVHAHHLRCQPLTADLEPIALTEPVFKFIVAVDTTKNGQSLSTLAREFPQLQLAFASLPGYPQWQLANVIDQHACKRKAFEWLLDYYQVAPENVISFGDSHSDQIFLELAGVGVAMGNASNEVQSVARFVTKTSCADGVAYALNRLIP